MALHVTSPLVGSRFDQDDDASVGPPHGPMERLPGLGPFRYVPLALSTGERSGNGKYAVTALRRNDGVCLPRRDPCRLPSFAGHVARHEIAPAAGAKGAGLVSPSPHLRAHPAVGVPFGRDPAGPEDVLGDPAWLLPFPQPVQLLQQFLMFAPRTRPCRGRRPPETVHRSSTRATAASSGSPRPSLAMIPSPGANTRPDGTRICRTALPQLHLEE